MELNSVRRNGPCHGMQINLPALFNAIFFKFPMCSIFKFVVDVQRWPEGT